MAPPFTMREAPLDRLLGSVNVRPSTFILYPPLPITYTTSLLEPGTHCSILRTNVLLWREGLLQGNLSWSLEKVGKKSTVKTKIRAKDTCKTLGYTGSLLPPCFRFLHTLCLNFPKYLYKTISCFPVPGIAKKCSTIGSRKKHNNLLIMWFFFSLANSLIRWFRLRLKCLHR